MGGARGAREAERMETAVAAVDDNLRHNKRLDRFTPRTRPKVNAQWDLYCPVHNFEKLAHHGYASWQIGSRTAFPVDEDELKLRTMTSAKALPPFAPLHARAKRIFMQPRLAA